MQTTPIANNLCANTSYKVIVTDKNGCKDSASIIFTKPSAISITLTSVTNVTCSGAEIMVQHPLKQAAAQIHILTHGVQLLKLPIALQALPQVLIPAQ